MCRRSGGGSGKYNSTIVPGCDARTQFEYCRSKTIAPCSNMDDFGAAWTFHEFAATGRTRPTAAARPSTRDLSPFSAAKTGCNGPGSRPIPSMTIVAGTLGQVDRGDRNVNMRTVAPRHRDLTRPGIEDSRGCRRSGIVLPNKEAYASASCRTGQTTKTPPSNGRRGIRHRSIRPDQTE